MGILELENVSFSYGKTKVLDNISYSFDAGHVYSIVGKSGAGKTTLLSILSGLAKPTSDIFIMMKRIWQKSIHTNSVGI